MTKPTVKEHGPHVVALDPSGDGYTATALTRDAVKDGRGRTVQEALVDLAEKWGEALDQRAEEIEIERRRDQQTG